MSGYGWCSEAGVVFYLWSAPELSTFVEFGSHLIVRCSRPEYSSVGKRCSHDSHSVHLIGRLCIWSRR